MTQLHQKPRSEESLSDEWETPDFLIAELAAKYGIFPTLDVACTTKNRKCKSGCHVDLETDALDEEWNRTNFVEDGVPDIWLNPPQSQAKEFVLKADEQWVKYNMNIMMIIPANSVTSKYFEKVIKHVQIYPIFGRITFLYNGMPGKYPARNGYFCVIWRKI